MKKEQDFSWINAGIIKKSALAKKIWGASNSTTTSRLVYRQKNPSSWKAWELERLETIAKELQQDLQNAIDAEWSVLINGQRYPMSNASALPIPPKSVKYIALRASAFNELITFELMNVDADLSATKGDWLHITLSGTDDRVKFLYQAMNERWVLHVSMG